MSLYRVKISGTGSYLPPQRLTNFDLEKMVDTNDAWIRERTGIIERRIAAPDVATSDMAAFAAKDALEMANLKPQDIDMIIMATVTPDHIMPNTACVLQEKLGCKNVMSFDLSAACTGFVYGLAVARQFLRTGVYKNILVAGGETLSRIINYKDRETCILFGDGAGAAILSRNENDSDVSDIYSEHLYADGSLGSLLDIPGGGSRIPLSQEVLDNNLHKVRMKGREIFKSAVRTMVQCSEDALAVNGMTVDQLDWFIPHQANTRILEAVAKHFGIPMEKVIINLHRTGNTSAGTIPIAFDEAVRDGRIKRGDLVLMAAFGAGLTSGSILLRF